ncbi:hypothetical protein ACFQ1S_26845, partial [Kibdelosporangium lantanae]
MRNPTVASVMTKDAYTVGLDTGCKTIVDLLASKQISAVAVLARTASRWVVSEADLLLKQEHNGHMSGVRPARPPRWSPLRAWPYTLGSLRKTRMVRATNNHRGPRMPLSFRSQWWPGRRDLPEPKFDRLGNVSLAMHRSNRPRTPPGVGSRVA